MHVQETGGLFSLKIRQPREMTDIFRNFSIKQSDSHKLVNETIYAFGGNFCAHKRLFRNYSVFKINSSPTHVANF